MICSVGCAICTFAGSYITNFAGFVIVYGLLFGVFSGMNYFHLVSMSMRHFPGKKGMVSGLASGVYLNKIIKNRNKIIS